MMRERFKGAEGRRRLVETLRSQTIIEGNEALAQEIAAAAMLEELRAGANLIEQGRTDNEVFSF
jgi:CRP/FNR family cyclic AMP-dependent transcriptional regulator